MNTNDKTPVTVSADERAQPAIRLLARACIALARHRLGLDEQPADQPGPGLPKPGSAEEAGLDD